MVQSRRRVEHEPAYVLHSYPYKETSLIVEAFSRRLGRIALIAKGARRPRSAMRGVLHAFQPLRLSWSGSGELNTLITAEWQGGVPFLSGFGLMCGFYVNELILRLLGQGHTVAELAAGYKVDREDILACQSYAADVLAERNPVAAE